MGKTAGRILKRDDVKFEGQFHLDMAHAGSGLPQQGRAGSATPQVNVVENHAEYAVIEVTCSCGARTRLRCEYAGTQAQENPQT